MKPPSDARKRTLELQARALRFSTGVNSLCPNKFSNLPSSVVWGQLVRAADSVSNNLLEADDASSSVEREAGELAAIFATIVLNFTRRIELGSKRGGRKL
jgi:hypothetical protein